MLRKKWIKQFYPGEENKFPNSGEVVLNRFVLDKLDFDKGMDYLVRKFVNNLSVIDDMFGRLKIIKGKEYYTNELFEKYRKGISLTFVYEPRDILKSTMKMVSDFVKKFMYQNYSMEEIYKFVHKWKSYVHSSNRKKGEKFVLVDIDFEFNSSFDDERKIKLLRTLFSFLQEKLENLKIMENLKFVVSTPSFGIHLVFKIDEKIQEVVFKNRENFKMNIQDVVFSYFYDTLKIKEIEVKTNPVQTHVPLSFINPNVQLLFFEN